jgi:ElaB/YqjD/DUF883 family membrane-anchored ribosome-binding protein
MDTLNKIKVLLGMEETPQVDEATPQEMEEAKEQLKFEEAALEDGTIISADAFEVGNAVFIVVEEDQQPLPVGEYALADGSLLVVEEEGVIAEIKSADEEVEEEVEEVVEQSEEVVEQSSDDSKEAIIQAIGVMENLLQEFNALKEEFASIKAEAQENAAKVEEFEKVGEEIKPNPEGNFKQVNENVDLSKLTAQQKVQYLIHKNK